MSIKLSFSSIGQDKPKPILTEMAAWLKIIYKVINYITYIILTNYIVCNIYIYIYIYIYIKL